MKTRGIFRPAAVFALLVIIVCTMVPATAEEGKKIKFHLFGAMYLDVDGNHVYNSEYSLTLKIDISGYARVSFPAYFRSPACAMVYDKNENVISIIQDVPYGSTVNYDVPPNAKYLYISVEKNKAKKLTVLGYETLPTSYDYAENKDTEQTAAEEPDQPEEVKQAEEQTAQTEEEKPAEVITGEPEEEQPAGEETAQPENEETAQAAQEKTEEEKATEEEAAFQKELKKHLRAMEKEQLRQDDWPLEIIVHDGGMAKIFRTIGVVGDSLSSGAMTYQGADEESKQTNVNMYEYSWIQYMARYCGSTAYNFSVSGMGTDNFFTSKYYDMMMDGEHLCQAYIIALGHNDYNRSVPIGSPEDVDLENCDNNKDTFIGNYARIISSIKRIQPTAKIFPILMKNEKYYAEYNDAIRYVSSLFDNVYLLEMDIYAVERMPWEVTLGHGNAMGYLNYSYQVSSYVDWYIRHYPDEFKYVQFIGTDYEYLLGLREKPE